jgi:hypothetical protein
MGAERHGASESQRARRPQRHLILLHLLVSVLARPEMFAIPSFAGHDECNAKNIIKPIIFPPLPIPETISRPA